jgi:phage-related tail fiber protein
MKKVIDANSGVETSAFFGKAQGDSDVPGRKLAEKNPINTIPAAEIENWKKAAQPVIDDWVKDATAKGANGKALLDSARALIDKYNK